MSDDKWSSDEDSLRDVQLTDAGRVAAAASAAASCVATETSDGVNGPRCGDDRRQTRNDRDQVRRISPPNTR